MTATGAHSERPGAAPASCGILLPCLRRMAADAPEKLRFLRAWLTSLAACFARVFEPLASGDAPPRLHWTAWLWVAALTIATRQHAQLLRLSTNTVELEAGTDSLATGQVIQWYGRAGPGGWPLRRLKVHAAMAYLCANAPTSAQGGGIALKGDVQTVRGMRFVNAGGLRSLYEPPCFTEVEPYPPAAPKPARSRSTAA